MSYRQRQRFLEPIVGTPLKVRLAAGVLGEVIAVLLLIHVATPSLAATANHVVIIRQMRFNPPQATVAVGDTVEWKNEDMFSHTVTADDGSFDSGLISPKNSWHMAIKHAGVIAYHCRPHPNMVAQLDVTASRDRQTPTRSNGTRNKASRRAALDLSE